MNELTIHSLEIKSKIPENRAEITIFIEENLFLQKKVYESRFLSIPQNSTLLPINDKTSFKMEKEELFISFVIKLFTENDSFDKPEFKRQFVHFSLTPDLNGSNNIVRFEQSIEPKLIFELKYDILTTVQKQFSNEKDFAVPDKEEEKSSMMEMFTVTNKFLKKITPLRRLQSDIEDLFQNKNFLTDFFILLFVLTFIFHPIQLLFSLLVYFIFSDMKYSLRFKLVEKSIGYFYKEDHSAEVKKNLEFIKKQQLMILEFLNQVKILVYFKNRQFLRLMFLFGGPVLILIVALFYRFSFQTHFIFFCLAIFALRYKNEFLQVFQALISFCETFFESYLQKKASFLRRVKNQFERIQNFIENAKNSENVKKGDIIWKENLAYEHKRYFMNVGWANNIFGGC